MGEFWNRPPLPPATYLPNRETSSFFTATSTTATSWTSDPRGWLAIDPKGLLGERAFDFVNILRNPDAQVALTPGRFSRQVTVVADAAGLDRTRLLQWTLAFTGLSAAWILGDGEQPDLDLAVGELAATELSRD